MVCLHVLLTTGEIVHVRGKNQVRAIHRLLVRFDESWIRKVRVQIVPPLELVR